MLFLFFMPVVTVSADILNPHNGNRDRSYQRYSQNNAKLQSSYRKYSSIQLIFGNVPSGMVLVLLGEKKELLQMAHNDKMITVSGESTLYLASQDRLSKPFIYGKDKEKLFLLIHFSRKIPSSAGALPDPITVHQCTVETVGPRNYSLMCK